MNEKEILARCEAIITEVDIEIMNWHHEIDLMSFIGQEVPLVMYTDDGRHEIGTARLIHDDGALKMTGEITNDLVDTHSHIAYSLGIEHDGGLRAVSLAPKEVYDRGPVAHFRMDRDGTVSQYVQSTSVGGELPTPVTPGRMPDNLREKIRAKIDEELYREPNSMDGIFEKNVYQRAADKYNQDLENHPFFDTKEND